MRLHNFYHVMLQLAFVYTFQLYIDFLVYFVKKTLEGGQYIPPKHSVDCKRSK
jgi:hypothetical protein